MAMPVYGCDPYTGMRVLTARAAREKIKTSRRVTVGRNYFCAGLFEEAGLTKGLVAEDRRVLDFAPAPNPSVQNEANGCCAEVVENLRRRARFVY